MTEDAASAHDPRDLIDRQEFSEALASMRELTRLALCLIIAETQGDRGRADELAEQLSELEQEMSRRWNTQPLDIRLN